MKGSKSIPFEDIFELLNALKKMEPALSNPMGKLLHNEDTFQEIRGIDDKKRLIPNKEMIEFYRGQTTSYPRCVPSLYRQEQNEIDQLIERLRIAEFETVLKNSPEIAMLERNGMFIDYIGLAQHYGMKTNVLDLTSDIDIVAFFACCPFDFEKGIHGTDVEEGSIGVIYKVVQLALADLKRQRKFERVGFEPFSRPAAQKVYSFQLEGGEDFTEKAVPFYFKHSKAATEQLFDRFGKGQALYPDDPIVKMAQNIREGRTFARESLKQAIVEGESSLNDDFVEYESRLRTRGFKFVPHSIHL